MNGPFSISKHKSMINIYYQSALKKIVVFNVFITNSKMKRNETVASDEIISVIGSMLYDWMLH